MNVELHPVAFEEKPVLRHLLELYFYDFSEFSGDDVNEHGEYGYRYLDNYWQESRGESRHAYFIRAGGRIAGFALVRSHDGINEMAEFFVMRKYRRQGVGVQAASAAIRRFPGRWLIRERHENVPAQAFWRRVIGDLTQGQFEETLEDGNPAQRFTYPTDSTE